mmetsp:Transcript_8004/g.20530  ORF Transcript_8004/g.20530 Transcript_8004/m.20530 type:complete len:583 (-) Transcript_8004:70-1818(-)|eukprot:CAMPEP_0182915126 /NCGR_PEP_ID=MMETSP0105_2-20130417/116_1 /TAXON_ID=81532 ORGANISM="Acanthoeca-like sp., Strain 10tr" /NCGR_SAMPLE_ID=MMETSP0105_2 /ASSEMBLY_ACC=CAM_ASM_000205 /LENGTH=582 /DNA_ID=CAMNT_0025051951 /DNA_START=193 /DNA_END=1941 /DNA_ORIENTATION=+
MATLSASRNIQLELEASPGMAIGLAPPPPPPPPPPLGVGSGLTPPPPQQPPPSRPPLGVELAPEDLLEAFCYITGEDQQAAHEWLGMALPREEHEALPPPHDLLDRMLDLHLLLGRTHVPISESRPQPRPHLRVEAEAGMRVADDDTAVCVVCASTPEDGPIWRCPQRFDHTCCYDCINHFAKARVDDGMSVIPCPCGYGDCAHEMRPDALSEILIGEPSEAYQALKALHENPNAVQCPTCNKSLIGNPRKPDIVCPGCSTKFCFHHGLDHGDAPCNLKRPRAVERFRNWRWRKWNTRRCRNCGFHVQKNGGCSHMICRCGHEICWVCGGDYVKRGRRGHNFELFPLPSEYKYCCNDKKMWAQRCGAAIGIATVGVAAAAVALACVIVYGVGRGAYEVGVAPRRAWMSRKKRREWKRRKASVRDLRRRHAEMQEAEERERQRRLEQAVPDVDDGILILHHLHRPRDSATEVAMAEAASAPQEWQSVEGDEIILSAATAAASKRSTLSRARSRSLPCRRGHSRPRIQSQLSERASTATDTDGSISPADFDLTAIANVLGTVEPPADTLNTIDYLRNTIDYSEP